MPKKIQTELAKIKPLDNKTIGERISEVRKKRGLTQLELSEKIGISRDLLCNYELSRNRIYGEMVYRIAIILEVSADRLLGIDIEESASENVSLRYIKRIRKMERLPEYKIRMILNMIDDSIKANKD